MDIFTPFKLEIVSFQWQIWHLHLCIEYQWNKTISRLKLVKNEKKNILIRLYKILYDLT